MTTLTFEDVRRIVWEARSEDRVPDLSRRDLSDIDLSGMDLSYVDLRGVNLRGANLSYVGLSYADLRGADLTYVDLSYSNLYHANLRGANLSDADLHCADLGLANMYHANLYGADLSGANLYGAYLRGADLFNANLSDANLSDALLTDARLQRVTGWDGLQITNLHRHSIQLGPTDRGWTIRIGCWTGTPDELETLIAQDDEWSESIGEQIPQNRPMLSAALAVIRAHIDAKPDAIGAAIEAHEKWENKNREKK